METRIGQLVRRARQAAGLTLEDVASRVGITVGALSHIESGRRLPSAANAALIAEALSISPDDILLALDEEHSLKREREVRSALANRPRRSADDRTDASRPAGDVFEKRPIEELFGLRPSAAEGAMPGYSAPDRLELRAVQPALPGGRSAAYNRNFARFSDDTSARIEALDRLADQAAEAIRTLRGLVDDEDVMVAREARRLLRELEVRGAEE